MPCFYCGKRVSLVRQLTDADFCSEDHRKKYHELTKKALGRLEEPREQVTSAPARRKGPGPATTVAEPPKVEREEPRRQFKEEPRIPPREEPRIAAREEPRIQAREERIAPAREDPWARLQEEPRHPASAVRPAPVPEPRPAPPPRRPEPILVPPPPPRQATRHIWEPDFEAGLIQWPISAYSMDPRPIAGDEIELSAGIYDLGRITAAQPEVGFGMAEPVWPTLDQNTLKRAGRLRAAEVASNWARFQDPVLQRAYHRWQPRLGAAEPGALVVFLNQRPAGQAGQASSRAPIAGTYDSTPAITLSRLLREPVPAAIPFGELDLKYARPAVRALRSAVLAESAPRFAYGYYLPQLPQETAPASRMPAGAMLAAGPPSSVKPGPALRRQAASVVIAEPGIWLPESGFRPIYTGAMAANLQDLVAGWMAEVPAPIGLPLSLQPEPTPTRAPRPAIPISGGRASGAQMPLAVIIPGASLRPAGTRKIVAAMTQSAPAADLWIPAMLPEALQELALEDEMAEAPPEAPYAHTALPGAMPALQDARRLAEQVPMAVSAIGLPLSISAEYLTAGAMPEVAALAPFALPAAFTRAKKIHREDVDGATLFAAAAPLLPESPAVDRADAGAPGELPYLELALPASAKGRPLAPMEAFEFLVPISSIGPLLPPETELPESPWLLGLAPMSTSALPRIQRPAGGISSAVDDSSRLAEFQFAAHFPVPTKQLRQLELSPGEFSTSLPAPVAHRNAPLTAGDAAPTSLAEPFQVAALAASFESRLLAPGTIPEAVVPGPAAGPRVPAVASGLAFAPQPRTVEYPHAPRPRVDAAEYAPLGSVRATPVRFNVRMVGPVTGECAVSLPLNGELAATARLSAAECFLQQPRPAAGAVPERRAEFTPCVPATADPELASFTLALAAKPAAPSSDLQSVGVPRPRTRLARPRSQDRIEMPARELSLLESPTPQARHTLSELAIIPTGVTPAARERRPAESLRLNLPTREPQLPDLDSADRDHVLVSGPAFRTPIAPAVAKSRPQSPAGALVSVLPVEYPRAPQCTTVHLDTGEHAGLAVRAAAWTLTPHPLGWAVFPPDTARMPDPRSAALGSVVLPVSGPDLPGRPSPKLPVAASPLKSAAAFPIAQPSQPESAAIAGPRVLVSMPPMLSLPAVFRGTPQTPWTTGVSLRVHPASLPGFFIQIPARLGLGGQGFEASASVRVVGKIPPGSARSVSVPIQLGDEIHTPEARLSPARWLVVASADLMRPAEYPAPRKVVSRAQAAAALGFPLAGPAHAQSQAIAAFRTLGKSGPWAVPGRPLVGSLKVSAQAVIGMTPPPAELPQPQAVALPVRLTSTGWDRVPPRTHAGTPVRQPVGWQALNRECGTLNFRSVASRHTAVDWPTRSSGSFLAEQKPISFGAGRRAAPLTWTEFACPSTVQPRSAGFTQALRPTSLAPLPSLKYREDRKTGNKTVILQPVFRLIRRPGRLPVFHSQSQRAAMPSGAFRYVEAHDDFDDFGTMRKAPIYEASPLNPVVPPTRHSVKSVDDFDCPYFVASPVPSPNLPSRPAGANEFAVSETGILLRDEVDAIPMEFDPALIEAGKSQGVVGALKSASRFFKFMVVGFGVFSTLLWHVLGGLMGQTLEARAAAERGPLPAMVIGKGFTTPIDGKTVDFRSGDRGEVVQDNRSRLEMTRSLTAAIRRPAPSRDRKGAL